MINAKYATQAFLIIAFNIGTAGKNSINGTADANSGGFVLSLAPGVLISYRNMMFKGGVKFAVLENLNGLQKKPDPEFVFAVEFHMPPFK